MEKEKGHSKHASSCRAGALPPASWGPTGTLGQGKQSLRIPLKRSTPPPRQKGSQSPLAVEHRSPRAHACPAGARFYYRPRVPARAEAPAGLCTPYLLYLTIRRGNTQGARLPVSPRSTCPNPAPSSHPDPRSRQLALKQENKGHEQLASPESGAPCRHCGDGGGGGTRLAYPVPCPPRACLAA